MDCTIPNTLTLATSQECAERVIGIDTHQVTLYEYVLPTYHNVRIKIVAGRLLQHRVIWH